MRVCDGEEFFWIIMRPFYIENFVDTTYLSSSNELGQNYLVDEDIV